MSSAFEITGGASIGWANATRPLAKLTATPDSLRVAVRILGTYHFTPDNVVAVSRYSIIPIVASGIQIQHCVLEYPARLIFWCIGDPDTVLSGIRKAGFLPRAPESAIPTRHGFALRWQAIAVGIAAWNGLMMLAMFPQGGKPAPFGPLVLLPLVLTIVVAVAAIHSRTFQELILKPGRSIGEIRPFLNLLLFIIGILLTVFSLVIIFQ